MAFDGFVISNIVYEMNQTIENGRIYKIYQPESDELTLVIKCSRQSIYLHLSANASLPLVYFSKNNKENPVQAPNFCMLLRKHIQNGRITAISQPGFERMIRISIEHLNELGDLCKKHLIIELMGKHSNIIFTDEEDSIIDSIKHIPASISSVREVLPGKMYVLPPGHEKTAPDQMTLDLMLHTLFEKPMAVYKALYTSITGLSPFLANELCFRAGIDGNISTQALSQEEKINLYGQFEKLLASAADGGYKPNIIYDHFEPKEFSSFEITSYKDYETKYFNSISEVIVLYYSQKEQYTRMKQKSSDLRRTIQTVLERTSKKYDLQQKQLKDTAKREKYKVYGELIQTYGFGLKPGAKQLDCMNHYTGKEVSIPLDPQKAVMENAQRYFERYNKQKRTFDALSQLVLETKSDLDHLKSIAASLDMAENEKELAAIQEELWDYGYTKSRSHKKGRKKTAKSNPLHFVSSDGYDMYVGKNNYQNDTLTFKFANGGDWWFHAKNMPGSHVIVRRTANEDMLPDATFEEAGRLAAYYSAGRTAPKVEIDYVRRKELKKPPGAKPGFVIYHTNYSMVCETNIDGISQI